MLVLLAAVVAAGALATSLISRRAEAAYPPVGRFVAVEGGRLHVIDKQPVGRPAAGTVVLLHGACGSAADMMLTLGAALASRYRVLAFDRPGHGWSDRPGGRADASPARQAALIRQALDALDIRDAIIVAHSWSGAPAMVMALDHDDITRGIVLLGAVTHPWPGGIAWHYSAAAHPWLASLFAWVIAAPVGMMKMQGCAKSVFAPEPDVPNYTARIGATLLFRPRQFRANAQDVGDLLAAVKAQSPRYCDIRVPVIIVHGDSDRVVCVDLHARALAKDVAGAKLIVLKGVGHMPHHTQADTIIGEIDALAETRTLIAAE
jgi:pimeloyl-ACP methyl ester carboxylesterase